MDRMIHENAPPTPDFLKLGALAAAQGAGDLSQVAAGQRVAPWPMLAVRRQMHHATALPGVRCANGTSAGERAIGMGKSPASYVQISEMGNIAQSNCHVTSVTSRYILGFWMSIGALKMGSATRKVLPQITQIRQSKAFRAEIDWFRGGGGQMSLLMSKNETP